MFNFVCRTLLVTGILSICCQFARSAGSDPTVPNIEKFDPRLVEPLELETFSVAGMITAEGARRLMDERIRTGDKEPVHEFLSTAITAC